ncbi:PepSY domain-containing protein [Mesobacillus harenae]|uniref:PepSY domain-containing protein n=1 Tax=Mesobacillus harenae TaxID=2213203 RepID=UPI00157FC729|nr:PepSY domain-containing protein [Mesobacillus harenae]
MNWKSFIYGVGIGAVSGFAAKELLSQKNLVSAEKVLDNTKAAFKKEGPISGSWINMNPEAYTKSPLEYKVYKGGITRNIGGRTEHFEFIADAETGTILDVYTI